MYIIKQVSIILKIENMLLEDDGVMYWKVIAHKRILSKFYLLTNSLK